MKQETKDLIIWIKKQINLAKENCINLCHKDGYPEYEADYDKAMNFLDFLPEIESKLCQGGYIQDIDGTPCCNGDSVKQDGMTGNLYWSKQDFCFYLKASDTLYSLYSNFRKVK